MSKQRIIARLINSTLENFSLDNVYRAYVMPTEHSPEYDETEVRVYYHPPTGWPIDTPDEDEPAIMYATFGKGQCEIYQEMVDRNWPTEPDFAFLEMVRKIASPTSLQVAMAVLEILITLEVENTVAAVFWTQETRDE